MKKIIFAVFLAIGIAGMADTARADYYLWGYSFTGERLAFTIRIAGVATGTATLPALARGQWLDQDGASIGGSLDLGTYAFSAELNPINVVRRDEFLWDKDSIPSGARRLKLNVKPAGTSVPGHSVELDRPLPDLAIDSIALDQTYGYPIVTIKNIGTYKAASSLSVFYSWSAANQYGYSQIYSHSYAVNLNNLWPGSTYIAKPANPSMDLAINPRVDSLSVTIGRTFTQTPGGNLSGGAYQILESDYANNDKNVDVDISFPDLAIDSVAFDPTYGYPVVTIKNIGAGKARHPAFRIYYSWSNGRYSRSYEVNLDLDPGRTYIAKPANPSFDFAPDPLADSINMNIGQDGNSRGQIVETDYDNNYYGQPVDVSFPDLAIDFVTFDPILGYPIVTIKNIGTNVAKRAGFTVGYEYSASGQTYGRSYNVDLDLAPGQTYIAKADNSPAVGPGIKSMVLTIGRDTNGGNYQIFESDYSNNRKTVDVILPDLAIKSVRFDQAYSYPIVTIENIGVSKARHPAFKISYKVNSALYSYDVNLDLDPGQTFVAQPVNLDSDSAHRNGVSTDLKIGYDAERNEQLAEFDYKNNKAVLPDFVIDSVTFNPNTKAPNVTISNVGSVTADFTAEEWDGGPTVELTCHKVGESSAEGYNCQQGEYLTASAQNDLDPGAKIIINFPTLGEDIKYIDVSVNLPLKLSELNLSNNIKNKVPLPLDLTKPALLWPTCTAEDSQNNNFSVTWSWPEDQKASDYQIEVFDSTLVNSIYQEWTANGTSFAMPAVVPINTMFFAHYRSATDRTNVSPWSDTALVVCAKSTLTATVEEVAISSDATSTPAAELADEVKEEIANELAYPIADLGNCQSKDDCKAYCGKPENTEACTNFGVTSGLMTEDEAEVAQKVNEISENAAGPGGCTSKESCEAYCEKPENIDVCLNYAEQNNIMSADDLAKARKVVQVLKEGVKTPGDCNSPIKCKNYCSDNTHAVECVAFGKSAGLLSAEEAEEAEKIAPLMQGGQMPGGGKNREETEAYCNKKENRAECDAFFERAGVKKGGATTTIFESQEIGGTGPGGCKTKEECDAFCDSHPGECDQAVIEAGGEVKEATAPCSTNQDCKVFCRDPANAKACENITIEESPEEAEAAKPEVINAEIEKLRQNILEMPTQSQDCVKQKWGAESFDRVMSGQTPETPVKAEDLQSCYGQGVIKAGEEAAKKPEGQEQRDVEAGNLGGSLLQIVTNFIRGLFGK